MTKLDARELEVLRHALRKGVKQSGEARFLHRLHCVLLVGHGHNRSEVAKWFGLDTSTLSRWVRHFKAFGITGLRDDRISGRPATLNNDQLNALEQDVGKMPIALGYRGARWDGKLLAAHLQKRFGVKLSVRQCQRLLRQLHTQSCTASITTSR